MSDLESRFSELALKLNALQGYWDNGFPLLQKLLRDFPKLQSELEKHKGEVSSAKNKVDGAVAEFTKLQSLVSTIREEFSRNLTTEIKNVAKNFDEKNSASIKTTQDKHQSLADLQGYLEALVYNHTSKIETLEKRIKEMALATSNSGGT